jgi:hypothetical protein
MPRILWEAKDLQVASGFYETSQRQMWRQKEGNSPKIEVTAGGCGTEHSAVVAGLRGRGAVGRSGR